MNEAKENLMSLYRNILIAAAAIPAFVLSVPFTGNKINEPPQAKIIYQNQRMPSENLYRKLVVVPAVTSMPTITPAAEPLEDYEVAVLNALNIQGAAPLREVDGYDPIKLAEAIMETESNRNHYNPDGSVKRGGAGEVGIMQILPSTGRAACGMDAEELMDRIIQANLENRVFFTGYVDDEETEDRISISMTCA